MRRPFPQRALIRLGLPLCGWLSLALFVFVASGLPIPLPFTKDLSRPFPCMFSQCGCRDAEQCWRSCCCHSAAERVAWAKKHQVLAPEVLQLAAEAADSCSSRKPMAADCCSPPPADCCEAPSPDAESVSLIAALKCQGVSDVVTGVPLCLPPLHLVWQPSLTPLAAIGPAIPFAASPAHAPAIPPPRSLV